MMEIEVQVGNALRVTALVARKRAEVLRGLRGAEPGTSMLLVMPTQRAWSLTMEGVEYDLDAIGFDRNGRVVDVVRSMGAGAPGPFWLRGPVSSVLEVPAGLARDVRPGQRFVSAW